jgi:hypothetical protein
VSRGPIQLGAGESLAAALLFFGLAVLTAVLGSGCGTAARIEESLSRDAQARLPPRREDAADPAAFGGGQTARTDPATAFSTTSGST